MSVNIQYNASAVDAWKFIGSAEQRPFRLLAITPCEFSDIALARAWVRHGGAAAVDIGRDATQWPALFAELEKARSPFLGIRIADHVDIAPAQLPTSIGFVIIDASANIASWVAQVAAIVQVNSMAQAHSALKAGATALIAKGQECGGLIGAESSFILLQRLLKLTEARALPIWCQGGIGLHTAAGAIAGGAYGVVLDSQLILLNESRLAEPIKLAVRAMDGSETRVLGGYQLYTRPGLPVADCDALSAEAVRLRLGHSDLQQFLPLGQDAALASLLAQQCPNAEALLNSLRTSIAGHMRQAQSLQSLQEHSPLARAHGTRFPIAQGPMTRVSDTAAFAAAVADNGALPFLALSLMNAEASRALLEETRARLGTKSWGVGVLGFADAAILNPQLELIREFRPAVVLLAGGRPAQARPLIELGITTYLHVPSPGLLELFLNDGARHFIFEGRECGGHVGPRFSFVLWEQQLQLLLNFERAEELHILFAGGIHDERSAAMIAVMAAPLAARGAHIGVLMGTAYIATREAVDCGAIVSNFQQQAVGSDQTVSIETAPGHAVRCLPSHFVQQFNAEKMRLQAQGMDQQQIWMQLEAFNIGRLRIATKGIARHGERVIDVDQQQQRSEGLYMIGQLIALRDKVGSMADLHTAVSSGAMAFLQKAEVLPLPRAKHSEPIAIVGMACIYPGSPDLETFWANILAGHDLVSEVPAARWNTDLYYRAGAAQKGKSPSKWGGFIDPVAFDPLEYGIPPQSLAAIEPVQLLSLEVAKRALRDAGYGDRQRFFDREKTAVIFGAEAGMDLANGYAFRNLFPHYLGELPAELDAVLPELTEDSFPGVLVNVISGRIANRLGLSGVNYSVDSACASSLTAVELAVKELRTGSSDMVLAGGADFHNSINDFLMFASVGALSAQGRCRSFDNSADGICLGEGVGVVVLKRLDDARRDGDRIYALIDGIAGSSDGKGLGLTAPRKDGQKRALERAYWQAGILAAEIGLVEAHGTGTVVGDKTELQTMTEVFTAGGALPAQAGLGSVKSQIGHTKCAAGIAGLIKISKALYHHVLPPTLHIETPNNGYRAASSPFSLNKTPRPWVARAGSAQSTPLRAAVSAFGFGGANFHAVLSSDNQAPPQSGAAHWQTELFIFRGERFADAQQTMQQLGEFLRHSDAPLLLRDLSFTVAHSGSGAVQCAFVATDCAELSEKLPLALSRSEHPAIFYRDSDALAGAGKIAFVFPGQGSQTPGMLCDLFVAFPQLQQLLASDPACAALLFPPTVYDREQLQAQQRALTDTRVAQPALGMVELAALELFKALGIVPAMAAGHSYGELVALASAGCFDAKTLLTLSRQRGEAMLAAAGDDVGKMAAVSCGYNALQTVLSACDDVVLANQNSTAQTVIAGPSAAIEAALQLLKEQGIAAKLLETACAFHSPVVARAELLFARVLQPLALSAPNFPVYSNTTTQRYQSDSDAIKYQLAQHIVSPVRFVEQIETMYADGARIFVEVGPKRVLSGFIQTILADRPYRVIAIEPLQPAQKMQQAQPEQQVQLTQKKQKKQKSQQSGLAGFLHAVAQLAVISDAIDPAVLYVDRNAQRLAIDTPQCLAPTCWWVDGGRAWPRNGAAPQAAGKVMNTPLQMGISGGVAPQSADESAVVGYLNNMREIVRAQRDVLMGFLGQPAIDTPKVGTAEVVAPAALAAPIERAKQTEPRDVQATLLAIVSERTGYPCEMLDLDLDLEADLSIDSIKRVEIIGELATRLDIRQRWGASADPLLEQLSTQKNLRAIIAALKQQEQQHEQQGQPREQEGQEKREQKASKELKEKQEGAGSIVAQSFPVDAEARNEPAIAIPLARYVLNSVVAPKAIARTTTLEAQQFIITDDSLGIAQQLAARLQARGALVRIIDFGEDQPLPSELNNIDGLIHLWCLNPVNRVRDVKRFFNLLHATLQHRTRTVLVASGLGGDFGYHVPGIDERSADFGCGAGLAGMLKSLDKECPEVRAHWVDLDLREAAEQLAEHLETELLADNRLTEVGYRSGARRRLEFLAAELPVDAVGKESELELNSASVVLLTGGAHGITARTAIELAQRYRCRIELVGRSPLPSASESSQTGHALDAKALRLTLIENEPTLKPIEVERRCAQILAAREIRHTLAAIEAAGATVNYTALDVRDIELFGAFIQQLYAQYGRIDGVIHGAGVIEDKLWRDKSADSFQRVFDTKVRGALMLYNLLRSDVKFVVFFSSVASAFGNRGQIDYAAANDVLDKIALALRARLHGRVVSINWGPWADTGMVSPALEREYARQGIGLIALRDGIAALLRELADSQRSATQVVLMCGTPKSFGAPDAPDASE